ncbi:MAG TPA: hypothetical protein VD905_14790 [Flavobacteriales bacterium]|nr:hypothetical protein [Flavobacteriales bacterium]
MFFIRLFLFVSFAYLVSCSGSAEPKETPKKKKGFTEDTCVNYVSEQKIKTKKTWQEQEGWKQLVYDETFDPLGRILKKYTYSYSGKNIYSVDRVHHTYTPNMHTVLTYTGPEKDSLLTMKQIDYYEKGKLVKKDFFEGLNTSKKMNSFVTYTYTVNKSDSTILEEYHLHNNDIMLHTYIFRDKKILLHTIIKNNTLYGETKYFYDTEGRLTKKTEEEKLWNTSSTEEFFWESGFMSRSTVQKDLGNNQRGVSYYTYDKKGNETSEENKNFVGKYESGIAGHKTKTSYFYIDCLLVEKESKTKAGITETTLKTSFEYTFY